MVTCTAIAFAILQHPGQSHASQSSAQAQQVVAENVGQHQPPLSRLKISHALERVAGESGERSTETDHHQQPPARIDQRALRSPNDEETYDEAARDIDEKRSVRKD